MVRQQILGTEVLDTVLSAVFTAKNRWLSLQYGGRLGEAVEMKKFEA